MLVDVNVYVPPTTPVVGPLIEVTVGKTLASAAYKGVEKERNNDKDIIINPILVPVDINIGT